MRDAVAGFLSDRLGLALRRDRLEPERVERGVDFVGWKTWWNRRLPRRRTLGNLTTRLAAFERAAIRLGPLPATLSLSLALAGEAAAARIAGLRATLASYAGHLRHGSAWWAWERAWARHPWLGALWRRTGWTFAARWSNRARSRRLASVPSTPP